MQSLLNLSANLHIILIASLLLFIIVIYFLHIKIDYSNNKTLINKTLINKDLVSKNIINASCNAFTNDNAFYTKYSKLHNTLYNFTITFYALFVIINIFSYYINVDILASDQSFNESKLLLYSIGNWKEFGINIKASPFAYLLSAWIAFIFCFVTTQLKKEIANQLMNILMLCIFLGILLMLFTFDIFNFYVACEISSVAIYAASTYSSFKNKKKNSLYAGLNYLIYGSVASFFILFGIGFLIFLKQDFSFSTFIEAANVININNIECIDVIKLHNIYYFIGIILLFIGLAIKLSIPPFICIVNLVYRFLNSTVGMLIASIFFIPFWYIIYNLKIIQTIVNSWNLILQLDFLNGYNILLLILCIFIILVIKNYLTYQKIHKKQNDYFYFNVRFFKKIMFSYMLYSNILYIFAINFEHYNFILFLIYESAVKLLIFLILTLLDRIVNCIKIIINEANSNITILLLKKDLFFLNYAIIIIGLHIFSAPIVSIFTFKISILMQLLERNLLFCFWLIIILSAIMPILLFNPIKDLFFILNAKLQLDVNNKTIIIMHNDENIIKNKDTNTINKNLIAKVNANVKFITNLEKIVIIALFCLLFGLQINYN